MQLLLLLPLPLSCIQCSYHWESCFRISIAHHTHFNCETYYCHSYDWPFAESYICRLEIAVPYLSIHKAGLCSFSSAHLFAKKKSVEMILNKCQTNLCIVRRGAACNYCGCLKNHLCSRMSMAKAPQIGVRMKWKSGGMWLIRDVEKFKWLIDDRWQQFIIITCITRRKFDISSVQSFRVNVSGFLNQLIWLVDNY